MSNTRTEEEIKEEFDKYCKKLWYGEIQLEVIDGLPKNIISAKQSVRLDIKNDHQDTTMK